MPKKAKPNPQSGIDIFETLTKTAEKEKKKQRKELLAPLGLTEYFVEGSIIINKRICKGLECKLCIKACPTSALYWKRGEVGLTEELCIYCGACVLSCIVDDCIRVERKRANGEVERFSKPKDFANLQNSINIRKLIKTVKDLFSEPEKQGKAKGRLTKKGKL